MKNKRMIDIFENIFMINFAIFLLKPFFCFIQHSQKGNRRVAYAITSETI
jgi:hypothetical protein